MVVDGVDVVAELAAHQSNLQPPQRAHAAALVALPAPAILRALVGDADVTTLRVAWMRRWAERLGGGDGALPLVDLDADRRSLAAIFRELQERGVERLVVIGARDQPGFARELTCRWPAELQLDLAALAPDLATDLASALHDDPARVPTLGRATRRLVAVDHETDPAEVAAGGVLVYARDRARLCGARHGFVPPAALWGTDEGNRIRERWARYWAERGWPAAVREAVLGLDPELEQRLVEPAATSLPPSPSPRAPWSRARVFAVTGLDGAGKSTHAAALHAALQSSGHTSCVLKLYRQGAFLGLADELSGRTRRGAPLASFRVSRIVKLVDSLRVYRAELRPALERLDAVVVDRYTETHRAAAAAQLGWDLARHPVLALFPPANRAFWLRLDAAEALRRLRARGARLTADEHAVGLAGYAEAFRQLATSPANLVLEATAPFAANAARIANETLACLAAADSGADSGAATRAPRPIAPYVVTARPAERPRAEPLPVDVGGDGPALGGEIIELATLLRTELGDAAAGVSAAFWVEAYAAQLVLDARVSPAASAALPLWPAALGRMPSFADLHGLDDLSHLLDAAVRVRRFLSPGRAAEAFWSIIAPSAAARRRLAAEYAAALAEVTRDAASPDIADCADHAADHEPIASSGYR